MTDPIPVALLAGERPGGSDLARHFEEGSSVLVELAGSTPLEWALRALRSSSRVHGGWLIGPDEQLLARHPSAQQAATQLALQWRPPEGSPASSLLGVSRDSNRYPLLVTTADHALLTAEIVDYFIDTATDCDAELVVGLVPYALVNQLWPHSKRTRLKLADGPYCGANLFLLNNANAQGALLLWQQFEAQRKSPWKLARRLGLGTLARYLLGRLTASAAAARFTALSGTRIAFVELPFARAAVDVDSIADWQLAQAELRSRAAR